jgi:hypothetical protein
MVENVRQSISISEENRWLENIENRPELLSVFLSVSNA